MPATTAVAVVAVVAAVEVAPLVVIAAVAAVEEMAPLTADEPVDEEEEAFGAASAPVSAATVSSGERTTRVEAGGATDVAI